MAKAVITLLGMIGHTKVGYDTYDIVDDKIKKVFVDIPKEERAIYRFSEELNDFSIALKQEQYINTLPLLIDVFSDRDIIPIATQKAKDVQVKTLEFLEIKSQDLDNTLLIDESDYESIFQQISELLQRKKYESFIIDLTHGFRHLPILMIVNLIIASMKDVDKIEHILFAKEEDPRKKYEIIDLMDYTGLAKLSFVLENFNLNYTVGNKLSFRNEKYQDLVDSLRIISGHILANSIKRLIENDNNLIQETIEKLEELQEEDKNIATFAISIEYIIKHLKKIEILKDEKDYIKLFKLSEMMKEREYLLNSITLLNESIGLYCAEKIRNISQDIREHIANYTKEDNSNLYELAHQSKNIIKNIDDFTGDYLFEPNKRRLTSGEKTSIQNKKKRLRSKIPKTILEEVQKAGFKIELSTIDTQKDRSIKNKIIEHLQDEDNTQLIDIIIKAERLRNNLAHGNSSEEIKNVRGTIGILLREYQKISKIPNEIDEEERFRQIEKETSKIKNEKVKTTPKGIDAPKEEVSKLTDLFNNR